MKKIVWCAIAACALSACATNQPSSASTEPGAGEYRTGSNIPRRAPAAAPASGGSAPAAATR